MRRHLLHPAPATVPVHQLEGWPEPHKVVPWVRRTSFWRLPQEVQEIPTPRGEESLTVPVQGQLGESSQLWATPSLQRRLTGRHEPSLEVPSGSPIRETGTIAELRQRPRICSSSCVLEVMEGHLGYEAARVTFNFLKHRSKKKLLDPIRSSRRVRKGTVCARAHHLAKRRGCVYGHHLPGATHTMPNLSKLVLMSMQTTGSRQPHRMTGDFERAFC